MAKEMDYSAVLRTLELASKHGFAALRAYCQASAILLPKFTLKQENSVKQNFSFRQVDFNNNVLVPAALSFDHEVVPDGLQGCLATIGTKGDGNCLFRAVSMLLFEDDSEHIHLRVRAVFELCQNYDYYLGIELPQRQQDVWKRLTEEQQSHGGIMQRQINHNLLVSSFQQDVVELAKLNGWATMYAVEALSNVVGRKIYSVCPDNMCSRLKDVYHKVVNPIVCAGADLKMPICILWGKDGHIDTRKPYQPNHFLPLIKYQIIADQIKTVPTYPALKPCILCEGSSWYTNLDQHYQAKHTESVSIDEAATESMAKTVKANFIEERMLASFCQIIGGDLYQVKFNEYSMTVRSTDSFMVAYKFAHVMLARGLLPSFSSFLEKPKLYVTTMAKTNVYEVWSNVQNKKVVPELELIRSEVRSNFIDDELSGLKLKNDNTVMEGNLSDANIGQQDIVSTTMFYSK